jgi:hypothetical protein
MAGYLQSVGFEGLNFGPLKIDYGPKGTTTHFTASCPHIQSLINYYDYIIQFGASGTFLGCDNGIDGVTGAEVKSLEVSIPGLPGNLTNLLVELYFDSWELLTNENTDSIFNNPLIVGSRGWMNANDKDVLSIMATEQQKVTAALSLADTNVPANAPHTMPTDARSLQIILEILKGQSEFGRPSKVLRHTSYCSPGALYNSSIAYEECIYTPPQLLSEVGSGWTYNLPPRLYSEISAQLIQYAPATEASYYTFGWKKTIGRESQLANFMIEREVEYCFGLWSNLRYALR